MSPALEKGIAAAKAGNKREALKYLREALLLDAQNANAWLWMSAMVDDPEKKRHCLKMVLELEPDNKVARNGLNVLNQNFPPQVVSTSLQTSSEPSDSTEGASQPLSAASALPSQPLAASQSLSSQANSASAGLPSRPVPASTARPSQPIPASSPVSSKPVPASSPVSSQPVSPFTTPEIIPDDPALIKTQAIQSEALRSVSPPSKPAFIPEDESSSTTDQVGPLVSQTNSPTRAGKRQVERAARDRRWQIIILVILALIIIFTIIIIAVFVYPKIMNAGLLNILPPVAGLPAIHIPAFSSGTSQPKQTPLPLPPQLGVFLVESGNYLALTPGAGRVPNLDVPTTTNKSPQAVFYDPSIDESQLKLYALAGGVRGAEEIINLDQKQGIITATVQNPLDAGLYCFIQSSASLKPAQQHWWCFNEVTSNDGLNTNINISPPDQGFYIIQNGMPVELTISSGVISSSLSKLPIISPSSPIVIANLPKVTPDSLKLVALVGGFGIQLSPLDSSIIKIYTGSPAEISGLETGDVILTVDGQATNKNFSLTQQLIEAPFGTPSKLYVQRGNHQVTLTVTRNWVADTTELTFNVVPKPGFFYLVPTISLSPGAYCYETLQDSWCFGVQKPS
ncbi:MAG TPA: PDZ domain-containing protein [Anaerolineaceae bacterium]|nr:PDZ domain-containing protein [Anaerolineaceae bacterium]